MTEPIVSFTRQYFWLSNFYSFDGKTVEHPFQAAKTDDPAWASRILTAPSPSIARQLGRRAPMRPTWNSERIPVMRALLMVKFAPATELAERLLATGDAYLMEGNTWGDTFWGVCDGVGENHLGRLHMWIRSMLGGRP